MAFPGEPSYSQRREDETRAWLGLTPISGICGEKIGPFHCVLPLGHEGGHRTMTPEQKNAFLTGARHRTLAREKAEERELTAYRLQWFTGESGPAGSADERAVAAMRDHTLHPEAAEQEAAQRAAMETHDAECVCEHCEFHNFVDGDEAASICGVKPGTIRVWCNRGKLSVHHYKKFPAGPQGGAVQAFALYKLDDVLAIADKNNPS